MFVRSNGRQRDPREIGGKLRKIFDDLDLQDHVFHHTRRTFGSELLLSPVVNGNIHFVASCLGDTVATTERTYIHEIAKLQPRFRTRWTEGGDGCPLWPGRRAVVIPVGGIIILFVIVARVFSQEEDVRLLPAIVLGAAVLVLLFVIAFSLPDAALLAFLAIGSSISTPFFTDHRRCGDLDGGTAEDPARVWMACSCGARIERAAG